MSMIVKHPKSQYSVEPNGATHISIWLLSCWCYKARKPTGTQTLIVKSSEVCLLQSGLLSIPTGLATPPPFPQQEVLNAHTTCLKTWRAVYTKGKGQGNQFHWERLHSVTTTTTTGWCLPNLPATEPHFYKPHVTTEALLSGASREEEQL